MVKEKPSIARNAFFQFIGKGGSAVLAYLLVLFIARTFGPEGFGYYSLAFAVGGILGMLFNGGIEYLIPKEVSRKEGLAQEYLVKGFFAKKISLALISLIAVPLLFFSYPWKLFVIVLLGCVVIAFRSFIRFFESFFVAFQKMETIAFSNLLTSGALLAASALAVSAFGSKLDIVLEAQVAAVAVVSVIVFGLTVRKTGFGLKHFRFMPSSRFAWKFTVFGAFLVVGAVYASTPTIVLSFLSTPTQMGFFTAALSLAIFLETIPLSIGIAFFPVISKARDSMESVKEHVLQSLKWGFMLGAPLALLVFFFPGTITQAFFGKTFSGMAGVLPVLAVVVFARFLTIPMALSLVATGHEKLRVAMNTAYFVLAGVLCFFFVPLHGALGAAISLSTVAVLDLILSFCFLKFREGIL